jgi:hypothetical protein
MQLREFTKITAKKLNESLAQRFGAKIDIDSFTTEQLLDARNKLRTKVFNVETTESFDAVQKESYAKNKLFLDVLNAAIAERNDHIVDAIDEAVRRVNEGAEDSAELVMAAKDMVDRVTGWMEDTDEMQTESMLELADAIRDEMGSEKAEAFTSSIKSALEQLYATMETTRQTLTQGVGMLTGEAEPMDTMGADDEMDMEPTTDMETGDELDMDMETGDDDFGAADAAAGGEEPMGREKRESVARTGTALKEKAVSKSQQQAAGAALAAKRGDAPKSKLQGASKSMMSMSTKELEKVAGTKHKGLPKKK